MIVTQNQPEETSVTGQRTTIGTQRNPTLDPVASTQLRRVQIGKRGNKILRKVSWASQVFSRTTKCKHPSMGGRNSRLDRVTVAATSPKMTSKKQLFLANNYGRGQMDIGCSFKNMNKDAQVNIKQDLISPSSEHQSPSDSTSADASVIANATRFGSVVHLRRLALRRCPFPILHAISLLVWLTGSSSLVRGFLHFRS